MQKIFKYIQFVEAVDFLKTRRQIIYCIKSKLIRGIKVVPGNMQMNHLYWEVLPRVGVFSFIKLKISKISLYSCQKNVAKYILEVDSDITETII